MKLSVDDKLPTVCAFCGSDSTQVRRLHWERKAETSTRAWYDRVLVDILVGGILALVIQRFAKLGMEFLDIELPTCRACSFLEPKVQQVDWENRAAKVQVDVGFKRAFERLGGFVMCPVCATRVARDNRSARVAYCPYCERDFTHG